MYVLLELTDLFGADGLGKIAINAKEIVYMKSVKQSGGFKCVSMCVLRPGDSGVDVVYVKESVREVSFVWKQGVLMELTDEIGSAGLGYVLINKHFVRYALSYEMPCGTFVGSRFYFRCLSDGLYNKLGLSPLFVKEGVFRVSVMFNGGLV